MVSETGRTVKQQFSEHAIRKDKTKPCVKHFSLLGHSEKKT